jgi:acyl-coenzyme A synthetase/AMP-(fatty) acid ligase
MNVTDAIFFQAAFNPKHPALIYPGGVANFGMLADGAETIAANLLDMGLRPGHIGAIRVRDPLLHVMLILGLGRIGCPSVSLPPDQRIGDGTFVPAVYLTDHLEVGEDGSRVVVADDRIFTQSRRKSPFLGMVGGHACGPEDTARIAFSSGSTGRPKAVKLSQRACESRRSMLSFAGGTGWGRRVMSLVGLDTVNGYRTSMATLRNGGVLCLAPDVDAAFEMIAFFQIEELWASPAQIALMNAAQERAESPTDSLRCLRLTGARVSAKTLSETERFICKNVVVGYGNTEGGTLTAAPASMVRRLPSVVGHILPGYEIAIVDDEGRPLPAGTEGLLRMRGANIASGYVDADDPENAAFADGWFQSKDIALIRPEDGLLTFIGRADGRINRGGLKFSPETVEEFLVAQPGVREAVVVSFETAEGETRVLALVVASDGALDVASLQAHGREQMMEMAPDDIFVVPSLAKTPSGKLARDELATTARGLYSAD